MTNNKDLLPAIRQILSNRNLKTHHKLILITVRTYQAEHGTAFPDYTTLAADGGMCKRKAQYVVKELVESGYIDKETRFSDHKQQSNVYSAYDAPMQDMPHAQNAPYKASSALKDLKDLEDDDTTLLQGDMEKFPKYKDVIQEMAVRNGGLPSYKDIELLDTCRMFRLPSILVKVIYKEIREQLSSIHVDSFFPAFQKFALRLHNGGLSAPARWLATTLSNENIRIRSKLEWETAKC